MRKFRFHTRLIIRFRRWCRKHYAAFRSIGVCVNIGNLRQETIEASLRKQPIKRLFVSLFTLTDKEKDPLDSCPEWLLFSELYSFLTTAKENPAVHPAGTESIFLRHEKPYSSFLSGYTVFYFKTIRLCLKN